MLSHLLHRFSYASVKWDWQVAFCIFVIWMVVYACAVTSIGSQPWEMRRRWIWISVVTLFPVIGLLIYLPVAFKNRNYAEWFIFKAGFKRNS